MHADDIILMSTTLNGLQKLVDKCIEISTKTVSASDKTEFCISKGGHTNNYITMNVYTIRPKDNLKYLFFLE